MCFAVIASDRRERSNLKTVIASSLSLLAMTIRAEK